MGKKGIVGPDDWKTNHRIYEYQKEGFSRAGLEELVDQGYTAYAETWKSVGGLLEILTALLRNQTARVVARKTIFNPLVKEWLRSPKRREGVS
jgi:hypothetical protein